MNFQDKSICCSDCGTTFTVSAEKQEFFQSWGINNETRRCPSCSRVRKSERYRTGSYWGNTRRQMFRATCAECGKNTEVPFEPRVGKRVYCSDCYRKVRLYR
jgi:CxxC-x17-CxxC domain-containing protein